MTVTRPHPLPPTSAGAGNLLMLRIDPGAATLPTGERQTEGIAGHCSSVSMGTATMGPGFRSRPLIALIYRPALIIIAAILLVQDLGLRFD